MAKTPRCPHCGAELAADAPLGLCPNCLLEQGMETERMPQEGQEAVATPRGGFVPPSPAELAPVFPQLEIVELLGCGGMGAVYKARQPRLDRLVALKIMKPEAASDPAFAERFAREARALARLSHPNIVAVFDFGQVGDLCYFLMEYVDGANLRQMERAERLSPRQALAIVPQICDALQYAHDEGVVHRDIKPENILVGRKGRVKIADFGLAKLLGRAPADFTLTASQMVLGTPNYMAPEQIETPLAVDHRADIYALGVVFYELLTGELPIGRFAPPSEKVEVDVRLDDVVLRALEKEPERRYQQASEVKTDVEAVAAEPSDTTPAARPAPADGADVVRARLRMPAIGLMVAGALNCLALPLAMGGVFLLEQLPRGMGIRLPGTAQTALMILIILAGAAVGGVVTIVGARQMMRLRSYGLAVASSILPMLPLSLGVVVGLPMGIWALIALCRTEVKAAFAAATRRSEREMPAPWRPRGIPQMVGGVAGVVAATGLASLLVCLGLWLIDHYGPASYQVADKSVRSLESRSSSSYTIYPVASGEGRTRGRFARPESLPRRRLTLSLQNDIRARGGGEIHIELDTLGYRYVDAEGREVSAEAGLSLQVLLDWMAASGVDVTQPGARHEAANLLEIARGCGTRSVGDLASPAAWYGVQGSSPDRRPYVPGSVAVDPWLVPAIRWASAALWVAACVASVAVAVRRARHAAQEQGAAALAEGGSTRWSGFCVSGFALALCAVVGGIREWRGEELWGRPALFLLIGLSAALASVGLFQIRTGRRGRGAGLGLAALVLSLLACAVFFITIHLPFDF